MLTICPNCAATGELADTALACGVCGHPVLLDRHAALALNHLDPAVTGIHRYAAWIGTGFSVSLGEVTTPLLRRAWSGVDVRFKLEYLLPSGSFKDRGNYAVVAHLADQDVTSVVSDSSGNAGLSLASYCAASGIRCSVFVPESASRAKRLQLSMYGADVHLVPGARANAKAAAEAYTHDRGTQYVPHSRHPCFLAGTESFAFEVWEQLDRTAPDVVVTPVGAGTLLLGIYQGFRRLRDAGLTEKMPRIVGVQSTRCAPLATAYQRNELAPVPVEEVSDILTEGVALVSPPRGSQILAAVRESGGTIVAVDDGAVRGALAALGRTGIFVEPSSALAPAAISTLRSELPIRPDDVVVVALTGLGAKAIDRL